MKKNVFVPVLALSFFTMPVSAKVWINEFMQSNIDLVRDDLNDFPDSWVELYNDSDQPVNMNGWYLSVKDTHTKGWKLEVDTVIPAEGYLLIYCDKAEDGLHTSFRLESGKGGEIYLFEPNGTLADKLVDIAKQPAPNIAYGRTEDGGENWAYFVEATPGSTNVGETATKLLPLPLFSEKGGIYPSEVKVSISLPEDVPPEVEPEDIFYTTDGSEPTKDSEKYAGELIFTQSTPLRAKIIKPGYLTNRSATQSYIITDRELTLPVVSISLDPEYLWDDKFGIYVKGDGTYEKANYTYNWRRPMNLEYFPILTEPSVLNQLEEMRISGSATRIYPQKSLILYANKRFGEKRYDYQLFADKPNQEIKSFMIRNSGNDFGNTSFRDAAIQLFLGGKVDLDYQAYQPAILFVNGEYFGIQNLRERSDEDFVLANYDGLEDIDMFENWWGELKAGDRVAYDDLMQKIKLPADQIPYKEVMDMVDLDEYMNYMILQIFVANADFPDNNVVFWRKKDGGKWRFIAKDLDYSLGLYTKNRHPDFNAMEHNTRPDDNFRKLFNVLLTQESFSKEFYNRFAIYMGDMLHKEAAIQIVDSLQSLVEAEMPFHIDRWLKNWHSNSSISDMEGWQSEVERMRDWLRQRAGYMYEHLNAHFNLKGLVPMKIVIPDGIKESLAVEVNGIKLRKASFDGQYFLGEKVNVRWLDEISGVHGWRMESLVGEEVIKTEILKEEAEYVIPEECKKLTFTLLSNWTSTEEVESDNIRMAISGNRLMLSGLQAASTVTVFDVNGKLITERKVTQSEYSFPFHSKGVFIVKVNNKIQHTIKKIVAY